jgi:L-malate glycosyltransferase
MRIGILDHTGASMGGGTLVAAHLASRLSQFYRVDLIRDWSGFTLDRLSSAFSLDLSRVKARDYESIWESFGVPGPYSFRQQQRRSRALTEGYDLFVYCGVWAPPFCHARRGLIYCHFPIYVPGDSELMESRSWIRRNAFDRRLRAEAYRLAWRMRLRGYGKILANSSFTQAWIGRRWNSRSDVAYPPIELEVPQTEKQNRIVSIGRFFGLEPRCKGHLQQVAAFREFLAQTTDRWDMVMIGVCHSEIDREHLAAVQEAARDLPIRFLVNVDREAVVNTLANTRIFWHTAGAFENKNESPVFAEHFGMATVEAMRAGCVPVVIDSGGQREIIQHGVNGFLCEGFTDLVKNTAAVVRNATLCDSLRVAAKTRSMDFSGEVFDQRVLQIVTEMLAQGPTRHSHAAANKISRAPAGTADASR